MPSATEHERPGVATSDLSGPPRLPRVSIGLPTFNRREYLLGAVRSALVQTYPEIEVIVSDNASTDGTWDALQAFSDSRLVLLRHAHNLGMTGNFNATLGAATGEYFLLLSDDDLLEPTAIERLVAPLLEDGTKLGISWCPSTIIDGAGTPLWNTDAGPAREMSVSLIQKLWLGQRGPRLASVLERTVDARAVGGYDEARFGMLCDTGNWGQVVLRYPMAACVPEPLVRYRVHPSSGTGAAVVEEWQQRGRELHSALAAVLQERGDAAGMAALAKVKEPLIANLTVDVLMRGKGTPGWIRRTLAESWRSRRYLFSLYAFRRLLVSGWKLFR